MNNKKVERIYRESGLSLHRRVRKKTTIVPRELIDRPKMGFGVPLHDWLRGPSRGWAEELLDEARLAKEGYFHPAPIRQINMDGAFDWTAQLDGSVVERVDVLAMA